jgi:putative DNA primase/helicase
MITVTPWQWVDLLYKGVTPPDGFGFAEFRLLDPHPEHPSKSLVDRLWMEWPSPESAAPIIPRKKWQKGHVYLGCALRTPAGQAANSGTRSDTHPTHLVYVDIDLKHTVYLHGQAEPETLTPDELREAAGQCMSDVLSTCEEHGLPVRAIVYSGQGLQVYWARHVRSSMEDTEAFNRGLAKLFEADPVSTDQARILRVPGWTHHKNPDRPLNVELWYADPDAWVEEPALEGLALRPTHTTRTGEVTVNKGNVSDHDLEVLQAAWLDVNGTSWGGNGRHQLALWVGGWLRSNGYSEADATDLVQELATNGADPALTDRLRAVRDAYRTDNSKGWVGLTQDLGLKLEGIPLKDPPRPNLKGASPAAAAAAATGTKTRTPSRNDDKLSLLEQAGLFLDHCAEEGIDYAYHEQWERWFEYRAGVYVEVHDNTMRKRLDQVMQAKGFTNLKRSDMNEILLKVAHTQDIGKPRVDQGSWELNTLNGILNLHTLDLRDHTRDHFSVVQAAADWNPDAVSQEWADFLTAAVPNQHDRLILQKFCGYALTGDTSAQKALLLIGEGGTGKSTFVRVVSAVLGGASPYSLATSSALENIRDGSFLVGNLVGRRMCVISELQRNVDWLPFKRITGEDPIGIDVKNKTPYTTKLDVKLIVLSNVLPFLGEDASNSSLTRRFLPVAFNVKPLNPDTTLEARLTAPENLTGILTWMVKGLRALRTDHMRFPSPEGGLERQIVEQSNRVITFLEDSCYERQDATVLHADLWKAYLNWCDDTRHKAVSLTRFSLDLSSALKALEWSAEQRRKNSGRVWEGFGIKGGGY